VFDRHRSPKTWPLNRQLEKHAAGLAKIDRLEPETIDHRRRLCSAFDDPLSHFELMRFIIHAPCQMMNAARAPRAAGGFGSFAKINVPARLLIRTVAIPSVLGAEMSKPHRVRKK